MGLQFENLVVHNRKIIWKLLGAPQKEVVMDGPFFQKPTTRQPGCPIDYMIQNLYFCEVKFSKNRIDKKVIEEMAQKRTRLKLPRQFSIRPVLIHLNSVEDSILGDGYFHKVIDLSQLFD